MADLTPEALAPLLWAAMCEDAETRYPGDPDSPRWDKLDTWGEEGEVARSGMLAVARKAMDQLAPVHAALAAELDDYRQRLAEALAGRPAVIDWTGPDEMAQATRDISQRVTGAFREGVRAGVRVAEDNPGIRPYHADSVTREPVTVSQDAEAIAARLRILAGQLAQARQAHAMWAAQLTAELEEARGQLVASAAPGDTVVIAFGRRLTAEEGHDAYERFRRLAPGVNIVIADDVAAIEVHRPDAENARYRGALEDIEARGLGDGTDARTARQALEGGR